MTRSLLVYMPGYPYAAETLMPHHTLAAVATALSEAGHEARVLDYGTVQELACLTAGRAGGALLSASAADLWEAHGTLYSRWSARRRRRELAWLVREAEERQCVSVVDEMEEYGRIDFVILYVPRHEDVSQALRLAQMIRGRGLETRLFVAGRHAAWYARQLLDACPALDAVCVGDPEPGFVALAEQLYERERWVRIPNLVVRDGNGTHTTETEELHNLNALPTAAYTRETYPAVFLGGKFRLFTILESRGAEYAPHYLPAPPLEERQVRVRSTRKVCEELRLLGRTCGARAFHFAGCGTPAAHFDALSADILTQRLHLWYSRAGHIHSVDASTTGALHASGCQAVSFRIDTGSQRLLEDYYGHEFGVTETESVLGACRHADIFTVAEFTYPIPEDDYHSLAETMRMIRRTRPDAVIPHMPELVPGADWHAFAEEFGWRADDRAIARWAVEAPDAFAAPGAGLPFTMKNRNASQIRREYADFLGELAFEKAPCVTPREAVLARVSGEYQNEAAYVDRLRQLLSVGDAEGLAACVAQFNEKAVAPSNTIPFTPYVSVRAVVGN